MSVGPEVAAHLATALSKTVGTTIFYDVLPEDAADGSVGVMVSHPRGAEHNLGHDAVRYEFPQVQVLVRSAVQATAISGVRAAIDAMVAITNETIGGVYYLGFVLVNGPTKVKKDANERWLYSATFDGIKAPS